MNHHLRPVAIMIEVTSRHMECTHFNLDYNRMPAIALQLECKMILLELHTITFWSQEKSSQLC